MSSREMGASTEKQRRFEESWRAAERKLGSYFYGLGCPPEDCQDLVQETVMRAWNGYDTLRGEFGPWVNGIARYAFAEYVRKRSRVTELNEENEIVDSSPGPGAHATTRLLVKQVLDRLDPLNRKCVILHDLHGLNFEEIGERLGISLSNVHYHYDKAQKSLREAFPDLIENFGRSE